MKHFATIFAPVLSTIANLSLTSGVFPLSEKCLVVALVIKSESLDKNDLMNYRSVSQLNFLSKFIERVISYRVDAFLSAYSLLPPF